MNKNIIPLVITTGIGVGLTYFIVKKIKSIKNKEPQIVVVNNECECSNIVKILKTHCLEYNVLGFDCEWKSERGFRHPVALLQLASHTGLCVIIRLCKLKIIPKELKELLEDSEIVKVGVDSSTDAKFLKKDYDVDVLSTFDLRHLADLCNIKPEGLAGLSKNVLNITLNKNWRLSASDWERDILTNDQIRYAAYDVYVGIEIFKKLFNKITKNNSKELLKNFFKNHSFEEYNQFNKTNKQSSKTKKIKIKSLENGEQNCCALCNKNDAFFKRSIVPYEYRKYFPEEMQDRLINNCSFHICNRCVPKINAFDFKVKRKLVKICNAPFPIKDYYALKEIPELGKIQLTARVLLKNRNLPEIRKSEMENIIKKVYPENELTSDFLNELSILDTKINLESSQAHSMKVVSYYRELNNNGLEELEKIWREHYMTISSNISSSIDQL